MKRYIVVMSIIGTSLISCAVLAPESVEPAQDSLPKLEQSASASKKSAFSLQKDDFKEDKSLQKKMGIAEKLVQDALKFFSEVGLAKACRAFEKDSRWRYAELNIDVFDSEGNCYLFGSELADLWVNFKDVEKTSKIRGLTVLGTGFIDEMLEKGDQGGGWVSFDWDYATNYSYVRTLVHEGVKYILCAGIYPESPRFQIRQLVKAAVRFAQEKGADFVFKQINNPVGDFINGDGYLWAYDMEGNGVANGRNLALVGQNLLNWKDESGNYRNKMIIDFVKKQGSGWVEYGESEVVKYTYVEGFTDTRTGKKYIIGGGYYPDISNDTVIAFVKKASEYLKAYGSTDAFRNFASYNGGFIKGPLRILALDLSGVVLADGTNPIFTGQNIINMRDSQGKYIIRDMLDMVNTQKRGWISYVENKGYRSVYAEYVETPDGKYILSSGYWPSSKKYAVQTLAQKAAIYLKTNPTIQALRMFSNGLSDDFLRGDLFVEVYTIDGICLSYGLDLDRVWNDEKNTLDEKGNPIIDRVIDMATRGGGWVEYKQNKSIRHVYTKLVNKPIERPDVEKVETEEASSTVKNDGVVRKETIEKGAKRENVYVVAVGYYE